VRFHSLQDSSAGRAFSVLLAIGNAMRRKGFKPLGVLAMARLIYQQNKLTPR